MHTPAKLSFTTSWSHHRSAKLCVTDFINLNCGKIVAFSILDKFINDEFVNYKRLSSYQEARCFELISPYLTNLGKIGTIIQDNNFKIGTIIQDNRVKLNVNRFLII